MFVSQFLNLANDLIDDNTPPKATSAPVNAMSAKVTRKGDYALVEISVISNDSGHSKKPLKFTASKKVLQELAAEIVNALIPEGSK